MKINMNKAILWFFSFLVLIGGKQVHANVPGPLTTRTGFQFPTGLLNQNPGSQNSVSIDFNTLQNHAAEFCLAPVPDGIDGACRASGMDCETKWMQCALNHPNFQCHMDPQNPTQLLCLADPTTLCDLKTATVLQTVRETCATPSVSGNGLTPIDPAHRQDFFITLQNKCSLLIKGGDSCSDALQACQLEYNRCGQADPFGCIQDDEAGYVACKVDPSLSPNACDDTVQGKLKALVPKECLRLVENQVETPPAQTIAESPILNGKGVIAGSGCSLSPTASGASISASLVFLLGLIPLILRMRRQK